VDVQVKVHRVTNQLRLNLGCGQTAPHGWENIDRSPNVLLDRIPFAKQLLRRIGILREEHMTSWPRNIKRLDLTKRLPYPDGSVAAVYSSHTLEHFYHNEATDLLFECRRVLQPGGVLRLALPNAQEIARQLLEAGPETAAAAGLTFTVRLHMAPLTKPTRKQQLVGKFASAPHRWQPTPALIVDMLSKAGFSDVTQFGYLVGSLPDLKDVEHRPESLFVEGYVLES